MFNPLKLESKSGQQELYELATNYYRVTHDAIRRYDKHHLIFGDRYEARRPIAKQVVKAAQPYVDVLSFQDFSKPVEVARHLADWHKATGKPVLLADHAVSIRQDDGVRRHDGQGYSATLQKLRELPGCVGFHLCGAYLRNRVRKRGLRDESGSPDSEALAAIAQANRKTAEWVSRESSRN